jgi:hypothetical protein
MNGNTSWRFPQDGNEKTPDVADLQPGDLVQRAFAILADEKERWRSARSERLRPGTSS